jgi:hypothetical protein
VEESEGINPLQLFTTLNSEPIRSLHELAISKTDPQGLEEVLPLCEDIDLLIIVGHSLIEDEPFRAVADPLHGLLLTTSLIIRFLLVDVAIEVVLMIRLPRLRTHIAETFPASTGHVVAAHRSLDCFVTPWTNFCVLRYPLCIGLLSEDFLDPTCLLLTVARIMVITLAPETEDLTTCASDRV